MSPFVYRCPVEGCEWVSLPLDESYWHIRYRTDGYLNAYPQHFKREHMPEAIIETNP